MLSMPRIVRPDSICPGQIEVGSPADPAPARPLSETKNHAAVRQSRNCRKCRIDNDLVKSQNARRGTTYDTDQYDVLSEFFFGLSHHKTRNFGPNKTACQYVGP